MRRGTVAAVGALLLSALPACDCDQAEEAAPASATAETSETDQDVRVRVRVDDFREQTRIVGESGLDDVTTLVVVEAPDDLGTALFDVMHEGAAPAEGMWRDIGAEYEVTLHRGFFTYAREPPTAKQVREPRRVTPVGFVPTPQDPSLADDHRCSGIDTPLPGAPLPVILAPGLAGVILPEVAGPALLKTCVRKSPGPAEAFWTPSEADVRKLEAKLPALLQERSLPPFGALHKSLYRFARQYVGVVREGRRAIYANVFPFDASMDWRCNPLLQCDPGAGYFGVEYDLASDAFTHVAFNALEPAPIRR